MTWTKARRAVRRALPWTAGALVLTVLLTPAWMLYAPAVADWRWAPTVDRARQLSFGGPTSEEPLRWRRDGLWWNTSFGTAWLEQVWTGPFFHHELTLRFHPKLSADGVAEAAIAEARRVFPDIHLEVQHPGAPGRP